VPLQWAITQNNLGEAFKALGERESGTETLTKAAAAYREALKEFDQQQSRYYWQVAQDNLGKTLALIAERKAQAESSSAK